MMTRDQMVARLRDLGVYVADVAADELTRQCVWVETDGGEYWDTTCGTQLVWEDGPPSRHGAKFCSRCGGQMVERPYVPPTDDTEETE